MGCNLTPLAPRRKVAYLPNNRRRCTFRSPRRHSHWRVDDASALALHANNRRVWADLRDRFPSPYTLDDADAWLRHCVRAVPATDFAIEVDGEAAGGIGVVLRDDVERISTPSSGSGWERRTGAAA